MNDPPTTIYLSCEACGHEYPDPGAAPEQCPHCDAWTEANPTTKHPKQHVGKYFTGLHPYMFRAGPPALTESITRINHRLCFHLRWPDGVEDDTPVVDEDFVGIGGDGVFYRITPESAL